MKNKKNTLEQEALDILATDPSCEVAAEDFKVVGTDSESMEGISRPSTSYWKDAMSRLFKNPTAVVCIIVLLAITMMAIFVPMLSPYTNSEQHLEHTNLPMFSTMEDGHSHVFGTDDLGRDIFTRLWHGARVSLVIAISAVFINFIVGVIYGGLSGYIGGLTDNVMMRFIEVINGIPYLIIVILFMMILPPGMWTMVVAYAAVGWTGMARLVRGQVIGLKENEFVVAAKAMGAKPGRIILHHLLPNTLSVVIVNITLAIPSAIFTEAFLSFIGLGVPIPLASWGTLASDGILVFRFYPAQLALPAFFISITMLAFNLLGDALRDAFDPRLRR